MTFLCIFEGLFSNGVKSPRGDGRLESPRGDGRYENPPEGTDGMKIPPRGRTVLNPPEGKVGWNPPEGTDGVKIPPGGRDYTNKLATGGRRKLSWRVKINLFSS